MPSVINPTAHLEDLAEMFAGGAEEAAGLTFDPVLCAAMAAGLAEAAEATRILVQLAEEVGLVDRLRLAAQPAARSAVERRVLAAMAAPLDPEGRVVAFPIVAVPASAFASGGSAA